MRSLTSLCCLLLAGLAYAEDTSLARLLPAETPVYIEAQNPSLAELRQMAMGKILDDPRLKTLLEGSGAGDMHVQMDDGRRLTVSNMMAATTISINLAFLDEEGEHRFTIENRFAMAWLGFTESPFPLDFCAAIEVDTEPKEAVAVIERIAAGAALMVREEKGEIDDEIERLVRHWEHKGVTISTAPLGPVEINLAPVGRLVVVATSAARIKDIIDRQQAGDAAKSLADHPRYARMLAEAPGKGTPTTRIMVNVDHVLAALQTADARLGAQVQAGLNFAGLGGLESLTTVARVDGEGVTATTSVNFTGPERRGAARIFAKGPPAKLGCLEFAPRDSLYVNCGTFDTTSLYKTFVDLAGMQLAMVQSKFETIFGLKLREDVLRLIGPEAALILSPNRGLIPDITIVCESPDARKLEANLLSMLNRVPWPKGTGVSTFEVRGLKAHTIPLLHEKLGNVPFAPTFGVIDGKLVIAAFPLGFQRIAAVKAGEKPNLTANRDFARLREHVPADAMGLSYLDMPRLFEVIYETGMPFLQAIPSPTNAQLLVLPEVDVYSKHLFGRIAWRTADDRGLKWQSYSSLDTSGVTISALVGGAVGFYYATSAHAAARAEERPPPQQIAKIGRQPREAIVCARRARQLQARMQQYEQEHGKLPDDLDSLRAKWIRPETFLVPGTDQKPYVYLGPEGKGLVLLHGYANGTDGRISVITKNMRLRRVTPENLNRLLEGKAPSKDR